MKVNELKSLENGIRKDIYNYIVKNPATFLAEIKRALNISSSTAMWHLKILENSGLIKSKKFGNRLHYFSSEIPEEEYITFLIERNKKIKDIINYLKEEKEAYLKKN